jgi:type II secretory pathway component GspD/PulD (secretin)
MLRITALPALVLCLVTNARAEAQEAPSDVHTPSHDLQSHITHLEVQAQLSKLKGLFEKIAKAELELATVVGETSPEQLGNFVEKKEKLIESLRVESGKTQERIYQSAKALPQGYLLQLNSNVNQPLSPDQAAQKLHTYSLKNSASEQETAPEVLAVKVKFTQAKLISELLWGVMRTDANSDVSTDERANRIVLRGEKKWIESARKLIETLDRSGSQKLKAAESR